MVSLSFPNWLNGILGLGGLWIVSLGLVSFYPYVAPKDRHLSAIGLFTGALAFSAITGWGWMAILDLGGRIPLAEEPLVEPSIFMVILVLTFLSLLCFGFASYRTYSPTGSIGPLLLLSFLAFLILVVFLILNSLFEIEPPQNMALAIFGVVALSLLINGIILQLGQQSAGVHKYILS